MTSYNFFRFLICQKVFAVQEGSTIFSRSSSITASCAPTLIDPKIRLQRESMEYARRRVFHVLNMKRMYGLLSSQPPFPSSDSLWTFAQ